MPSHRKKRKSSRTRALKIVKAPKTPDLEELYGKPEEVVRQLYASGASPDEISRKYSYPYHHVWIYLKGYSIAETLRFAEVAKFFDRVHTVASVRGKEKEIYDFLVRTKIGFEKKVGLVLGDICDGHTKVGENSVLKSVSAAAVKTEDEIKHLYVEYGEPGDIAALVMSAKLDSDLSVDEVYYGIKILPELPGLTDRIKVLSSLLAKANPSEARYISRLALGGLRIRMPEPAIIDAVSKSLGIKPSIAHDVCSLIGVREGLLKLSQMKGEPLRAFVTVGQFIRPMLAHLFDPEKVVYPCMAEWKYDGSRLQIHKRGDKILLFSRRAIEKSATLPEIVEIARGLSLDNCIIDSEVVATDREGRLLSFHRLLERTVTREYKPEVAAETALSVKIFDVIYQEGTSHMKEPLSERRKIIEQNVPTDYLSRQRICQNEEELHKFYDEAIASGLEGIVVKDPSSVYEPGVRSSKWQKLKVTRDTIDAVVVEGLYGTGQRAGLYSSFRIAIRDVVEKKLYTIGKVSNLTEEMMARMRNKINSTKVSTGPESVRVRPEVVFEVTYQEIQESPDESSGYALRVPKLIRIREDKTIEEIDTLEKIKDLFKMQYEERFPSKDLP